MSEKHTIEQLQAMSDEQLAELTARVRGWTLKHGVMQINNDCSVSGRMYHEDGVIVQRHSTWNPPANIAQAYGLLVWITATHGLAGWINFASPPSIELWKSGTGSAAVPRNDARAMCYAFVLAMQEVSNGK